MIKVANKNEFSIKESVKKFSDEDVKFIYPRLMQRVGGDLSEALVFIQERYSELNRILIQAGTADAVYDIVDIIDKQVQQEHQRRFTMPNNDNQAFSKSKTVRRFSDSVVPMKVVGSS